MVANSLWYRVGCSTHQQGQQQSTAVEASTSAQLGLEWWGLRLWELGVDWGWGVVVGVPGQEQ